MQITFTLTEMEAMHVRKHLGDAEFALKNHVARYVEQNDLSAARGAVEQLREVETTLKKVRAAMREAQEGQK